MSFFSLLSVALIVLKLLNLITLSWFWVLSPIWISFVVVIMAAATYGLIEWFKD